MPVLPSGRLVLFPADAHHRPDVARLRAHLHAGGLLGAVLTVDPPTFARGARFFDLIGFTGCAVQLDTGAAPPVHLRLDPPSAAPRPFWGRNTRPPRCPQCRRAGHDWRAQVAREAVAVPQLQCSSCGCLAPAWAWDWRHTAAFACLAVVVEEVFPGEARPLPALLHLLHESDGQAWRWCAIQDGSPQSSVS